MMYFHGTQKIKVTNLLLLLEYLSKFLALLPRHGNNSAVLQKAAKPGRKYFTELKIKRDLPKCAVPAIFLFNLFALLLRSHSSS